MANPYRKSTRLPEGSTKRFPIIPRLIATTFGVGFLPVCPGTWGALAAIILWLPLYLMAPATVTLWVTAAAVVVFALAGVWASNIAERYWGEDPVVACVDETVGQWITLLPVMPCCPWWEILLALALFRFFDIFKPLGIRHTERLPGGWGMMADDILAGIYGAVVILIINGIRAYV